jgi:DNA-binding YbaB/EbfC family protein
MNFPPGGPPDFSGLLAQAQQLQQQMIEVQEKAKQKTVEASAGGGMVVATVTGGLELKALKIDPQCFDPKDPSMLQDLVIAAVNQALAKAQEMVKEEVQRVAGGLLPPGMSF